MVSVRAKMNQAVIKIGVCAQRKNHYVWHCCPSQNTFKPVKLIHADLNYNLHEKIFQMQFC